VECVLGLGAIEALQSDRITIKLDYGKSVTFSSLGPHVCITDVLYARN
jgi:hypothetical protein